LPSGFSSVTKSSLACFLNVSCSFKGSTCNNGFLPSIISFLFLEVLCSLRSVILLVTFFIGNPSFITLACALISPALEFNRNKLHHYNSLLAYHYFLQWY
jgi:hypothetical protein